jgi:hypothetical protein
MTGSADYVTGPWRYERFDGVDHWVPVHAPDRLNRLLLEFLGGNLIRVLVCARLPRCANQQKGWNRPGPPRSKWLKFGLPSNG